MLGVLYDYMNEKIEHFDVDFGAPSHQRNKYITDVVRRAEVKDKEHVSKLRKEMKEHLLQSNKEVKNHLLTENETSWFKHHYHLWAKKLFLSEISEDHKQLKAALLYEETTDHSIRNSTEDEQKVRRISEAVIDRDKNSISLTLNIFVHF